MSQTGAAIHRIASNLQPQLALAERGKRELRIGDEVPKTFSVLTGHISEDKAWHHRVRNHLSRLIVAWGRLWDLVEHGRYPLTLGRCRAIKVVDQAPVDLEVISYLWSFLGQHKFGGQCVQPRVQAVNGEVYNGPKLRRRLCT